MHCTDIYLLNKMPLKCCISNCQKKKQYLCLGREEISKDRWVKFTNRRNWVPTELFRNFIKHFQPMYKQGNRNQLLKHLKPVPTIFDPKIEDEGRHVSHESTDVDGGNCKKRVFQER